MNTVIAAVLVKQKSSQMLNSIIDIETDAARSTSNTEIHIPRRKLN